MRPKVTVLLAVKDGEPYIRDAVASVLEQTFTNFELLIVDDASTDRTVEIVRSFADRRIRVIQNSENVGQVPSLNRGLHEARGEYVARLDADDACRPARLQRQVDLLDAEPRIGLVGTWMEIVGERGQRLGWLRKSIEDFVDFVYHTLIMRVYVSHPSAMYRLEPVLAAGGYDEKTGPAEDKDLWRKLVLSRWDARIVPEPLVVYRLHDRQLSWTQAAHQREVDDASQDRFLAELSPAAPAAAVRVLLAGDTRGRSFDPHQQLAGLELVLAGAHARLRLDSDEARRLDERVLTRLLEVARLQPWHSSSRTIVSYALAHLPTTRRPWALTQHGAALVGEPVRTAVRRSGRRLSDRADAVPALRALREQGRQSRLARNLYGKLVGGR